MSIFNKSAFLRTEKIYDKIKDLTIQLVEYNEGDGEIDFEIGKTHEYEVNMFGITKKGQSVCVRVQRFKPFFFIEVPKNFKKGDLEEFKEFLEKQTYKNQNRDERKYKYALDDSVFSLQKSIKCDGFQQDKTNFVKIQFKSLFGYRKLREYFFSFIKSRENLVFGKYKWIPRLYESDIAPLLRFFHERDVKTCGWLDIDEHEVVTEKERISQCQYECITRYDSVTPSENQDVIGPLIIASFDIECTSGDGSFPCADRQDDKIIQIGTTFEIYNNPDVHFSHIITLGGCSDIKEAEVVTCDSELELLQEWCKLMKEIDPDIITGYNINTFDFKYMYERMEYLLQDKPLRVGDQWKDRILPLGRLKTRAPLRLKRLESSALGQNDLVYLDMIGRINMDMISYIRREFKLDSYSLNNVSKKFLNNQQKNDVTPNDIFRLQNGSDDDRKIIAEYCIQDCRLCNKLITKLSVIENTFGMATTCYIPNNYISFRGQGIKGHSLVVKYATDLGYLIPSSRVEPLNTDYKGATVIDPEIGSHFYPVSCLDFASLYPSCMISHNLCITSIITDEKDLKIPGREYKKISWEGDDGELKEYTYIQPESDEKRALLPTILQTLLKKRKDTRKLQQAVEKTDPFKAGILNGLQLSYKITANSIYGLLGAKTSAISRPEIAASITTTGRALLDVASSGVMKHFRNSRIVYGDTDSIFVKFEIKRHTEECDFHKSKIEKRFKRFNHFVKKYTNDLKKEIAEGKEIDVRHSKEETAMHRCNFELYKECDCPIVEDLMSKEALQISIDMAMQAEHIFDILLPRPHKLEYEKTYLPYISFAKKRYIGYLYEFDVNKSKLDYKGIVLKRRDNADIVKHFYNGSIDFILAGKFKEALQYVDDNLEKMFNGEFDLSQFTITKTLKTLDSYKISFLKKKFYIKGALLTFKLKILGLETLPVDYISKIIKMTGYNFKKDYEEYVSGNEYRLLDMIMGSGSFRDEVHKIDLNRLKKDSKDKLRETMKYNELLEILEECDFNMKEFKKLKKLNKYDKMSGLVCPEEFLKKYELLYSSLIGRKISQSHVALNEKLKIRDLGSAYNANDRIPFCFIQKKLKKGEKILQSDIVETPDYIKSSKKVKVDYLYYLEKQIMKPLIQLFETIRKQDELNKIIDGYITRENNKKNGIKDIMSFF